jgi:preprotein translocase subunit SecA
MKVITDQMGWRRFKLRCKKLFRIRCSIKKWIKEDWHYRERDYFSFNRIVKSNFMAERAVKIGVDVFRQAEKTLMLQVLDQSWKDHLLMLDQMRQSIGLRAYAQKDPLNEYKREAFELFGRYA